jgi:hypothetical protein
MDNILVPFWRISLYICVAYFAGFYLGTMAVTPEISCVKVDDKIYCGLVVER